MVIPTTIPIQRQAGYHTDTIGRCGDGSQFVGFCFFLDPGQRRLVSVLHLFDANGTHIESQAWESDAEQALDRAIADLCDPQAGDVAIQPFSVELLGTQLGLIPRDDGRCVEYLPYGLAFFPPWDGTYDT